MSLLTEVDNPVTGNASRASFEAVSPSSLCGLMRLHGVGGLERLDAFMSFLGLVSFVYFLCLMGHLSIDWAVYIHRKKK